MQETRYERRRHRLVRFGRKNRICSYIVLPVLFFQMLFHKIGLALWASPLKIVCVALSLLYLPIFTSFSIGGTNMANASVGSINFGELDENISIVEDLQEMGAKTASWASEDSMDVSLSEGENASSASYSIAESIMDEEDYDTFEVSDILENAMQQYGVAEISDEEIDLEEYTFDASDWRYILVNKSHFIPSDYEVPLGSITGSLKCDERIIPELLAMLKAASEEGISLKITSPYRTSEHQVELFDRKVNRYMAQGKSYLEAYQLAGQAVTIPGTSEHEIGLSFDITSSTYSRLNAGFGDTLAGKWLAQNSYKYGFILRYPKEKEYITTIEYEPWHFRYVGIEAATLITREGITLEEFWEEYL